MKFFWKISSGIPQEVGLPVVPSGRSCAGRNSWRGFTLVEIMVAISILSLMIVFLFSIFNQATQAWQASEKKVDAFREARAALFVMRRDLSGLQVSTNLPMVLNQNLVNNMQALSTPADQLFAVSSLSRDTQGDVPLSDFCALGYYVSWGTNSFDGANNNFSGQSYNLFRYFQSSGTNYFNMTNFWTIPVPSNLLPSNLQRLYPNASTLPQVGDEVLARNVIGFKVRPYYYQPVVTAGVTNTVLFSTNTAAVPDSVVFTNKPAFLDISLTVINYATAAQLGKNTGQWNSRIADTAPNSLVNQNKQEFFMRVPLTP